MALKKKAPATVRVRCVDIEGCSIVRTWSDQATLHLSKGDTVDVPADVAAYLDSLTNWDKTTKRAKRPKKEHQ